MPDGGIFEDFLHIAGLIDVSVANGTMRPFVLVGIENTQRRRDLTGPTEDPEDLKIAQNVGESARFREFLRTELIPMINETYAVTQERAIIGESLAGLFVVETAILEPELFDYYFAIDPSLWWNQYALVRRIAPERLKDITEEGKIISLSSGTQSEIAEGTRELTEVLSSHAPESWQWSHTEFPEESHGTIYHPAALKVLRTVLAPAEE
jgi:predicted alpha/beta superfamily hydrolase